MGSGETAPTMVGTHRLVLGRLGPPPVPAVLLDTPFGFQENAHEIAARAISYFRESLQTTIEVATTSGRRSAGCGDGSDAGPLLGDDPFAAEELTAKLRDARYVFSGPGSPTFALRRWRGGVVPGLLVEKLTRGGAVTFASAAALTLGAFTVPVYEIYKAGADPRWLDGLDVLGAVGLDVAIVPHYNNAEGGTHDTRFCYLGERRLAAMEELLPESHAVLGIDEHTACVVDLGTGSVSVTGLGVVTVRKHGRSTTFAAGTEIALTDLLAAAHGAPAAAPTDPRLRDAPSREGETATAASNPSPGAPTSTTSPLLDLVREQEAAFAAAVGTRDATAAVVAVLGVEQLIVDWSTDIPQQDELDRARASLRTMVVELGRLAEGGLRDPRAVVGPFVDALVALRRRARVERRFEDADTVREVLSGLGVELRDSSEGTEWLLTEASAK